MGRQFFHGGVYVLNLVEAIVKAWEAGYTIFYPKLAKVGSVSKDTLSCRIDDANNQKIRWNFPGKPAKDSNAIVIYPDNSTDRAFAFAFSKFEEIDTKIGTSASSVTVFIDKDKVTIDANGKCKVVIDSSTNEITIEADDVKIKGDVKIDGDVEIDGELKVTKEITAQSETGPVKLSTHTHTGNLGAPTGSPTVGS